MGRFRRFGSTCRKSSTPERGQRVIKWVRSLQPDIMINNRTGAAGDYDTPEQEVGRMQTDRPWETCMTICQQWAWKPNDDVKSLKECLQALINTVGGDGNLLFNVGPMPDGRIEPRQVERLKEMGAVAGEVRREHLRHSRRAVPAGQLGHGHSQGQFNLFAYPRPETRFDQAAADQAEDHFEQSVLTGGTAKVQADRRGYRGFGAQGRPAGNRYDRRVEVGRPGGDEIARLRLCLIDGVLETFFRLDADETIDHLAVFEDHERGDAADAVRGGRVGAVVDVDLGHFEAGAVLGRQLLDDRSDHATWAAPGSPKIDQHGLGRFENLSFKFIIGNLSDAAHGRVSMPL